MNRFLLLLGLLLFFNQVSGSTQERTPKSIRIKLVIHPEYNKDTFQVSLYEHLLPHQEPDRQLINTGLPDNTFVFDQIENAVWIIISRGFSTDGRPWPITVPYLAEPGDDIIITISPDTTQSYIDEMNYGKNYKMKFQGKGSLKYQFCYELGTDKRISKLIGSSGYRKPNGDRQINNLDTALILTKQLAKKYQATLPRKIFEVIRMDMEFRIRLYRLNVLRAMGNESNDSLFVRKKMGQHFLQQMTQLENNYSVENKLLAPAYADFTLEKYLYYNHAYPNSGNSQQIKQWKVEEVYQWVNSNYAGPLRDKLLALLIFSNQVTPAMQHLIEKAMNTIETEYFHRKIQDYADKSLVGKPAVNFSFPDVTGKKIALSDFKDRVVFLDFWYKNCPACIDFYQTTLKETEEYFQHNKEIVFITINVDKNKDVWLECLQSGKFTSNKAINLFSEGQGSEHPFVRAYMVNAYPKLLIVDKNGNIFNNNTPQIRVASAQELIGLLEDALKHGK